MLRHLCIILLVALSLDSKAATEFTDSLHLIVHHQKIISTDNGSVLQFDVSIYRPNDNWNDFNFDMGDADFYFTFNENAFAVNTAPGIVAKNDLIDLEGVAGGVNKLAVSVRTWWASSSKRLHLRVGARKDDLPGILKIPLRDTILIATIQWPVAPGNRDPKIEWDMTATGLLTLNNNPIIPAFVGEIDKYPNPGITIDTLSPAKVWACEGSDVLFFVKARSTGSDIRYQWMVSDGGDWNQLATTPGQHSDAMGFDYLIHGAGDTLVVRHAPGLTDHLKLQCEISDPTLDNSTKRLTETRELLLRDSLKVFLSAASNVVEKGATEVKMCPTASGSKVRLNIWGPDYGEENEMFDVYVEYFFVSEMGALAKYADTVKRVSYNPDFAEGMLFYKELTVKEPGAYYVTKASTSHCYDLPGSTPAYILGGVKLDTLLGNVQTYAEYDTLNVIYSTSPDTTVLERYSVAMGVDTNLMVGLSGDFSEVYNLYDDVRKKPWLGDVLFRPAPDRDTVYHSRGAGVDTVYYVKKVGDCPEVSMREVEVINNYYAQIKVNLEGPMMSQGVMRCFTLYSFPMSEDKTEFVNPYNHKVSMEVNKFQTDPDTYEKILPEGKWCDWINVKIRDGAQGNYVDSVAAILRNDGLICDIEGNPYVALKNVENGKSYYIVIEHMNHISIMSAVACPFSTSADKAVLIDLTNPANIYSAGDPEPLRQKFSKYCMYAGDLNRDGFITSVDISKLNTAEINGSTYSCDINQDGVAVLSTDKSVIVDNNGKGCLF